MSTGLLRLNLDVLREVPQFAIDWACRTTIGDPRWGFGFDRLDYDRFGRIWLIGCRGSAVAPMFPLELGWNSEEDIERAFQEFFESERWAMFAWTVNHNLMNEDLVFDD